MDEVQSNDKIVTLTLKTPSSAVIGCWNLILVTRSHKSSVETLQRKTDPVPLYLLFNPWLKGEK